MRQYHCLPKKGNSYGWRGPVRDAHRNCITSSPRWFCMKTPVPWPALAGSTTQPRPSVLDVTNVGTSSTTAGVTSRRCRRSSRTSKVEYRREGARTWHVLSFHTVDRQRTTKSRSRERPKEDLEAKKRLRGLFDPSKLLNTIVRILLRPHSRSLLTRCSKGAEPAPTNSKPSAIGVFQRPWRHIKRRRSPENVYLLYLLTNRSYNVHANHGFTGCNMSCFGNILDTGEGWSLICKDVISELQWYQVELPLEPFRTKDAGDHSVSVDGTITFIVELHSRVESVPCKVIERWYT